MQARYSSASRRSLQNCSNSSSFMAPAIMAKHPGMNLDQVYSFFASSISPVLLGTIVEECTNAKMNCQKAQLAHWTCILKVSNGYPASISGLSLQRLLWYSFIESSKLATPGRIPTCGVVSYEVLSTASVVSHELLLTFRVVSYQLRSTASVVSYVALSTASVVSYRLLSTRAS